MILQDLRLVHFKNHSQADFQFSPKLNALVGSNGAGKTTVLDAVHVLCMTRSYFHSTDSHCIQFEAPFFVAEGRMRVGETETPVYCGLKRAEKKVFKADDAEYPRLADHLGRFPVVMISPSDRDLITEGSEARRKFMDGVIAQSDKAFLDALIQYNRALSQRNALLKYFAANRIFDASMLELYDSQLCQWAPVIHSARKAFIESFEPRLKHYYHWMAGDREEVGIAFKSGLLEHSMEHLLQDKLAKDRVLQYTSVGPHREDLIFTLHGEPLQRVGSQGQQKSYVVALKLAVFDALKEALGIKPILLLDDIFDKLDAQRVEGLIRLVNEHHFGQIFITDTHPERTALMVKEVNEEAKVLDLSPKQ
ncbi:DNA replication and repair protein RecF [Schleiferiaceae bacterium]|nr:DNA replication and repair protein RecF [Schleiferiaceae bacterium]